MNETVDSKLKEVAARIRELREIAGMSVAEAAALTEVSEAQYLSYEEGKEDLPFTFIHKCTQAFHVELSAITEGHTAKLSSYTVTRNGKGQVTAEEQGILIKNLAPMFKNKLAEPY
ncbi:MAG: helix-turn-helix transcriptional regulator, partial [Lachnospiraceae bacterium]|nr:helix-turn-helix transcriptional regulator [Lachnospiraceae bacterium]